MLAFLSYQLLDHKKEESSPCWSHVLRSFTWNFGILQNNIENLRVATKFFFQHLNEKENQLNYVLAVLYKQCIKNDLALFIQEEGHNSVPDLQKKTNFWVSAGGSCAVLIGCGCVWWTCWPSVSQTCSIGDILALNVSQESCSNSSAAQTQLQSASASVCISQWVWCH